MIFIRASILSAVTEEISRYIEAAIFMKTVGMDIVLHATVIRG